MRHSFTYAQGKEMSRHRELAQATGVKVYFCDPHSPWQRGTCENTNGLLRQYLPKGTDLGVYSQDELDTIADSLNNRPRATHGFNTPLAVFALPGALCEHAALIPEHMRGRSLLSEASTLPPLKRRPGSTTKGGQSLDAGLSTREHRVGKITPAKLEKIRPVLTGFGTGGVFPCCGGYEGRGYCFNVFSRRASRDARRSRAPLALSVSRSVAVGVARPAVVAVRHAIAVAIAIVTVGHAVAIAIAIAVAVIAARRRRAVVGSGHATGQCRGCNEQDGKRLHEVLLVMN